MTDDKAGRLWPWIISGAIQYGFPTTVYLFLLSGFLTPGICPEDSLSWFLSSTMSRASPKSATTTLLFCQEQEITHRSIRTPSEINNQHNTATETTVIYESKTQELTELALMFNSLSPHSAERLLC